MSAQSMRLSRALVAASTAALVLALAACSSAPRRPAPVEDRGAMGSTRVAPPAQAARPSAPAPAAAPASAAVASAALPGAENAGKPGFYTVKPGDTLVRIGLESGQNWRDIARWNRLDNPNVIEVGQVLRVLPPDASVAAAAQNGESAPSGAGVEVRPVAPAGSGTAAPAAPAGAAVASATAPARPASASRPAVDPDEDLGWTWPVSGSVIAAFDEQRNKGLGLSGSAGDPVLAAADGRVVYAGSGLRGYGNLIIVKHNNTFLSAYAHNQTLLVREDQTVRRGQKIAEMGSTDTDRVKLHFEIRRQGKPVDPARYLPPR